MTRIKKYVAAAAVAAAVVGVPTMAQAFTPARTAAATAAKAGAPTSARAAKPAAPVRVVAPGERVQVMPQVQLWLTEDGKHWSTPTQADQFRSTADGNLDMSHPDVSLQAEPVQGRYFLSGICHGKGDAAGVKVVTDKGTVTGHIVRLAGQPGWGAWYATSPLPSGPKNNNGKHNFVHSITVTDTTGHTMASLTTAAG
ncbi:hypothetical protein [Streptomyces sp. NK08204]|uniref:hypothetical protein n=1 Tax=Streptomyces sp. NK08204 TaxID=2873260 RepID=UPI001CED81A2|nr:hypothetical protein [Streptomyces sp. NK08204]